MYMFASQGTGKIIYWIDKWFIFGEVLADVQDQKCFTQKIIYIYGSVHRDAHRNGTFTTKIKILLAVSKLVFSETVSKGC